MIIICNHYSNFQAGTLDNVTKTIGRLLDGYDIRLRPNFGGKALSSLSKLFFSPAIIGIFTGIRFCCLPLERVTDLCLLARFDGNNEKSGENRAN